MWVLHLWRALHKADAAVALERENVQLRQALARAEQDFEHIIDELTDPATVRRLPEFEDGLWRNVRDRCRVARDEVRRALQAKAA